MTLGPQGPSLGSVVLPGAPEPGGQNNAARPFMTALSPPVAPLGGQPSKYYTYSSFTKILSLLILFTSQSH